MKRFKKIISLFVILSFLLSCHNKNFNSQKWKAWEEKSEDFALRWDMCDDLIENYLSIGMTKDEIVKLLGKPISDCKKPNCDIIYDLGPCRSGINYGSLYMTLKNNRIVKIYKHCG